MTQLPPLFVKNELRHDPPPPVILAHPRGKTGRNPADLRRFGDLPVSDDPCILEISCGCSRTLPLRGIETPTHVICTRCLPRVAAAPYPCGGLKRVGIKAGCWGCSRCSRTLPLRGIETFPGCTSMPDGKCCSCTIPPTGLIARK